MKSSQIFTLRYYVRPTALRMQKQYIIYYQTWTWVFSTGSFLSSKQLTEIQHSYSEIFSGFIPFIILVYLNIRILISLKNLRSRLNVRYHSENNPVKGKNKNRRVFLRAAFSRYLFLVLLKSYKKIFYRL